MKKKVYLVGILIICIVSVAYAMNVFAATVCDHNYNFPNYCSICGKYYGTGTCSKCGRTYTRTDSCSQHTCSYSYDYSVSATCTSQGYKVYSCSCGDSYKSYTSALGHNYATQSTTSTYLKTAATCTSPAVYYYKCSRCTSSSSTLTTPTTYTSGNALGHTYEEVVVIVPATCTISGMGEKTCTVCNTTTEVTIESTGHNFTQTCPLCGTENVVCSNEGCTEVSTHICDQTPPEISFGTNGSTTISNKASTVVTITDVSEIDASSLKYLWTESTTQPSESSFTESFINGEEITTSGKTGTYYLWILAKDVAGNTAIAMSGSFELDGEAPEGVMSISSGFEDDGMKYTNTHNLTLTFSANDNKSSESEMQIALINENEFSLTNPNSEISWQDFSESIEWTTSAGDGLKRIYVIFKDAAGNQSLYLAM